MVDDRLKRSKLDWNEYSTLTDMKRSAVKIPQLKIPALGPPSAAAQAFITETRDSPVKRPSSRSSLVFQRKFSYPVLPSAYQAKLPSCREMLQQLDRKKLSFKIGNLRSRSPSTEATHARLLSPVGSVAKTEGFTFKTTVRSQPKRVVKSKSVRTLLLKSKKKGSIVADTDSQGGLSSPNFDTLLPTKHSFRDSQGFIVEDLSYSGEDLDKVLECKTAKKSKQSGSPGPVASFSTGRSLLSHYKITRSILQSPPGGGAPLFTPTKF